MKMWMSVVKYSVESSWNPHSFWPDRSAAVAGCRKLLSYDPKRSFRVVPIDVDAWESELVPPLTTAADLADDSDADTSVASSQLVYEHSR